MRRGGGSEIWRVAPLGGDCHHSWWRSSSISGSQHPPPEVTANMSSAAYTAQLNNTLMPALAAVREDIGRIDADIRD